ncbi:MAG: DUF2244 domain-containing protein [Pseudomonadota bacterium]
MTSITDLSQEVKAPKKFIVRRNQSLSWQGNKVFILIVGVLCFAIAIGFATQGLWLILPFAGLEILALTIGLYICCLRNRQLEVITIDENKLLIEKGEKSPTETWEFDRTWVSLELQQSRYQGHPSKLIVRSKGEKTEIGKCLTDKEKQSLADSLLKTLHTTLLKS